MPGDLSMCDAEDALRSLASDPARGLTSAEASRRLDTDGANELRPASARPLWRRVVAQFEDPIVYLLLVAAAVALAAWIIEGGVAWPVDAIVIALVLLVNGAIGYAQEARAERAVAALARMTEATSAVVRDGKTQRVPSAGLVRGDILVLSEGDSVGADARLLSANSLRVLEASLTGESEAVIKDAARLGESMSLGDRRNMVFRGTAIAQGTGRAVVAATGMRTEMGAIAAMLEATVEERTPLQKEISLVGRMLGVAVSIVAVVVVATILLVAPIRTAGDVFTVLLLGVSLAVAAVPEGLPAVLSVVLAIGVQRMSRRHAVVKTLSAVEALGAATVICSDKTGTLTRSEMTIQRVATASGASTVTGLGYVPEGRIEHAGRALDGGRLHAEHVVVLGGGSLASNADLRCNERGEWEIHGDPTEAAFLVAERKLGTAERRRRRFERVAEVPFSADRKMMSIIARDGEAGGALVLVSKGAPDVLIERCHRVRIGLDVLPFDAMLRARARADVEALSDSALRTLAVAYRPLGAGEDAFGADALERDLIYVGTVGIMDPPREEAAIAVREAQRAGIRVLMITGDHPRTAARIAADVGIIAPGAPPLTGADLDRLDSAGWRAAVRTTSVFARVAPAHKLRIVDALQADGNVVAMTGDGVNDAPALKAADIGIAMGIAGTEVTKESAKMILADDNFATIVEAVREGRTIFDNIRKVLRYLLSSNLGEVLTVFLGVVGARIIGLEGAAGAGALVLPLLATQVLWINLITDSAPALAMGVDPETDDVMARPPRPRSHRAIDARMWRGVVEIGVVMAAVTLLTLDLYLPGGLIDGAKSLDNARTAAFTVLVMAQLFNCFNARSETTSAFHRLFVNGWLWAAIALSLLLQVAVVQVPVLNTAFRTVPLTLDQWAVCAAMSSLVLVAGEARKVFLRRDLGAPSR